MNVWNKVFLGVIIATSIVVAMLASVEYKIRSSGQKTIATMKKQMLETDGRIANIIEGNAPSKHSVDKSPSEWAFEELRGRVIERYYERGRVWSHCIVANMSERTLPPALQQVLTQIIITGPFAPSEFGGETDVVRPDTLKGTVYVFAEDVIEEGGNNAGAFLARFNVEGEPTPTKFRGDEGDEKNGFLMTLITIDPLSDVEIEQIFGAAQSRWAIYTTPPLDQFAGIFDQLTEEEKQMIPEELREKFQPRSMSELTDEERQGVDSDVAAVWTSIRKTVDDPEDEWAQDFSVLLDWLYRQRSTTLREIKIAKADMATYEAAEEKTQAENVKLTGDCILEEKRVDAMTVQWNEVKKQLEAYEKEVASLTLQVEKLQTLAAGYVKKITEYQLQVIEKIEGKE